ncbi:MAG: manganese-dependent inorganic pyrophosphatase [bacterium]|nr:manganese-dependent inorganic pyrophosphatase [bacterium]
MIYIIGHKNPDTDSICSAIALTYFLKEKSGWEVKPARAGDINPETKFVLEKFGFPEPELLENADGKQLVLVDHNEKEQIIDGSPKIIEVIDHHKINFSYPEPINFISEAVGSTATIIAEKFFSENMEIPDNIAGILLCSILSDTVIFKSPTTTEKDKKTAEKLNKKLNFDLEKFGKEIKQAGMDLDKPAKELILRDFKEFIFGAKKFGIGQIEIVGIEAFLKERKLEINTAMEQVKQEKGYDCLIFAATDILKEGSEFFIEGQEEKIEKIFNIKLKEKSAWIDGMMSRKKQIIPPLDEYFKS